MRILRHFDDVPPALKGAVVAIGNFDGVHRGHQALIGEARSQAFTLGAPLVVLSFEPHPQDFFRTLRQESGRPPAAPQSFRLTPLRTKARLISELGVDLFLALNFDAAMAQRSAEQFVREILAGALGARAIVVGRDFQFGRGRAGNAAMLATLGAELGFSVTPFDTIPDVGIEKISSSRIREALKEARPQDAARLLGRTWAVEARVEHGDARGRTMGFPTANMHLQHCLAPAYGVYAVRVKMMENDRVVLARDGAANFGVRPMYQVAVPLLETHLFDFDGDLYGKYLSVELVAYIRPEAKFAGLEALVAQIAADTQKARQILEVTPELPALDA